MRVPTLCPCVCAPLMVYVCMQRLSHADLGTHKRHMTPVDKWKMAQTPTPDVTMSVSLGEGETFPLLRTA